jgi:hypothetical protein
LKNISQKFLWLEGWKKKYRSGKRNCPHTQYWVVKWAMEHKIWNMIYYWKNWNISSKYYQINNFCSFKFIILFVKKKVYYFMECWSYKLYSSLSILWKILIYTTFLSGHYKKIALFPRPFSKYEIVLPTDVWKASLKIEFYFFYLILI